MQNKWSKEVIDKLVISASNTQPIYLNNSDWIGNNTEEFEREMFTSLVPTMCGGLTYDELMDVLKQHYPERFV